MDVQGSRAQRVRRGDLQREQWEPAPCPTVLSPQRVGRALGEWQRSELRLARSFPECRDLAREQLEDLYQETTLVLLGRSFQNEEHLLNALRWGIKHRALHLHRDERRRGEILAHRAPELQLAAEGRADEHAPEHAAVHEQDRLIAKDFLTELTDLERRVFWLIAEGMRYRAIAPVLQIPVNEARKAARSCERKRERFQLLYDTGRLCGFRSQTIQALQAGRLRNEELAQRAFAHLEGCAHCRSEHRTNARRLRQSFQGEAAALLPVPALAAHLGWLARIAARTRPLHERLATYAPPPTNGGVRDAAAAVLAGGGAAAKLAAGVATVAVIAGGTLGATHAFQHPQSGHQPPLSASKGGARTHRLPVHPATAAISSDHHAPPATSGHREPPSPSRRAKGSYASGGREPGGFAFLGVPSGATQRREHARATAASSAGGHAEAGPTVAAPARPATTGGGPFSP